MESERQGNDEPLVAHPTMAFVLDGILILAVAVVGLWMFGSLRRPGIAVRPRRPSRRRNRSSRSR